MKERTRLYWTLEYLLFVLDLFWSDEIGKSNISIWSRSLLEPTQLVQINEIIWNEKKLEAFTDNFLNNFS